MNGRIVIVGSGETSPTMVKVHREVMEQSGPGARVMLDTPFGFQVNADDLTQKIQGYFAESVGIPIEPARWRRIDEPVSDRERAVALLRRASWVFAGPGSPSYALRQWEGSPIPVALVDVVERGGTVLLGSAAAVTVGSHAVPVYEIYKVGDEPTWLPGLNLLGSLAGLDAAVVPHFDNHEGGRHDTRFCYLGESRLEVLEEALPAGVGVLGVDEHTAVVFDLGMRTASVHGVGGLTLRYRGVGEVVASGESIGLDELSAILSGAQDGHVPLAQASVNAVAQGHDEAGVEQPSLRTAADQLRTRFDECLERADADGALAACLDLEEAIQAWSADTLQGDDLAVARQALRSMLVDLAGAAVAGLRDPRAVLGPVVAVALEARARARAARDYDTSDGIRDGLAGAGIELRDTPDGMEWSLAGV